MRNSASRLAPAARSCCFLLFASLAAHAQQDIARIPGFEHFYNLEYEPAISEFRLEAKAHPNDADAQNHLAQSILYRDMFRAGALESEFVTGNSAFLRLPTMNPSAADVAEFAHCIERSLAISQNRLNSNPDDVGALYSAGVAYGLRANYNYLVTKRWIDALHDATFARKMHNHILEVNPNFIDARMVQGIYDYLIGSLPRMYRMLGFLAGYHGDRESGLKSIELVAQKGNLNLYDARVLLAAIYRREKRQQEAIRLLDGLIKRFPRNYLFKLETVQMYADLGEKDKALAALHAVEALKEQGSEGTASLPMEKLYYFEGNLLFWYNDLDKALALLQKASAKARVLDPTTGVFTYMRQGQIYDLRGDRKRARKSYEEAISIAPDSEPAKESRSYLNSPYRRTEPGG